MQSFIIYRTNRTWETRPILEIEEEMLGTGTRRVTILVTYVLDAGRMAGHGDIGKPVAPVAYQVILEPGIGQFCEFEPRRVHTRINPLGFFLCTN